MNPLLARSSLQAARMAVPRQAVSQQARNVHFENKVYNVLPFRGGPQHKLSAGLWVGGFFLTAAGLPFVAVGYQMLK